MDREGFEPSTSAMPMPYPTRLDDRPFYLINFCNALIFVEMEDILNNDFLK